MCMCVRGWEFFNFVAKIEVDLLFTTPATTWHSGSTATRSVVRVNASGAPESHSENALENSFCHKSESAFWNVMASPPLPPAAETSHWNVGSVPLRNDSSIFKGGRDTLKTGSGRSDGSEARESGTCRGAIDGWTKTAACGTGEGVD